MLGLSTCIVDHKCYPTGEAFLFLYLVPCPRHAVPHLVAEVCLELAVVQTLGSLFQYLAKHEQARSEIFDLLMVSSTLKIRHDASTAA